MIITYNIISMLLDYPSKEVLETLDNMMPTVEEECVLDEDKQQKLATFIESLQSYKQPSVREGLIRLCAYYSDLFDSNAKTSLYLFDMVYGASRDRGQAMVDLKEEYLKAGLMPDEKELPDYLPMFLQYVAAQPDVGSAKKELGEIQGVLKKMAELFKKHDHPYLPLIEILID
ncbi:MAG: nitrate reductase molybdenum cofactor assembly chaperone [Prevotella sp.]